MFSGQEQILDQMGTITLAKDGLKLYNDVDSGKSSRWYLLSIFSAWTVKEKNIEDFE